MALTRGISSVAIGSLAMWSKAWLATTLSDERAEPEMAS